MRHARLLTASAALAVALLIGGCSEGPTHPQTPRTLPQPSAPDHIIKLDSIPLITTLEDELPLPPDSTNRCGGQVGSAGRC